MSPNRNPVGIAGNTAIVYLLVQVGKIAGVILHHGVSVLSDKKGSITYLTHEKHLGIPLALVLNEFNISLRVRDLEKQQQCGYNG